MYVLTIDQARSRERADAVPGLLAALADLETIAPFERTVGDEIQGVVPDAATALTCMRRALASAQWHIGLGLGDGELRQEDTRSGTGPAFLAARTAVEASKSARVSLAVRSGRGEGEALQAAADAQALLRLLGAVVVSRTAAQRTVVELLETGMSGKQAATHLGVSQQAVSRHRTVAAWAEEEAAIPALVRVLDHAHQLSLTTVPGAGRAS